MRPERKARSFLGAGSPRKSVAGPQSDAASYSGCRAASSRSGISKERQAVRRALRPGLQAASPAGRGLTGGHRVRFTFQTARWRTADVQASTIGPCICQAQRRRLYFLFPHMREGAERRKGASVTNWHLWRCRVPYDRHARLPALHCGDFGPCHRVFFHQTGDLHLT